MSTEPEEIKEDVKEEIKLDDSDFEWVVLSGLNIVFIAEKYEEAFEFLLKTTFPNCRLNKTKKGVALQANHQLAQIKKSLI